jgi:hypothetical protein
MKQKNLAIGLKLLYKGHRAGTQTGASGYGQAGTTYSYTYCRGSGAGWADSAGQAPEEKR